ncbi:hypothetical protein GpartN1_g5684.t1 [Galdieria partita]|uniref:RWP-RK domain-containing protein n=1 Tax=Galdieria partita TaxID=83374 RepID=A0A9C7PZZ4_9RHOD|nr:hypothetical protein GpartN1_g5684.t1 [Galdieria partita]
MQEQLFYNLPQEAFFFNSMGSFEKKQLYNSVNNGLPVESCNLQTPAPPLPSFNNAFSLNSIESPPGYFGALPSCDLQNQGRDNIYAPANIHASNFYSPPPPVSYMHVPSGMQQVYWSTSPMTSHGPSLASPEPPENRKICNLSVGTELHSPSLVLPPLTPRSFETAQHFVPNAQNSGALASQMQPQLGVEGTVNSPRSINIGAQGLPATSNYEATLSGGYADVVGTANVGMFVPPNSTSMATSLPNCSSPNRFAAQHDSKGGHHGHLLSVKERFPDLWKYGGLDGRFSSHRKDNIDLETLKSHFHLPMVEASKKLGVCVTVLKKICRRFGISRWPHRKLRSVAKHIEKHEKAFHKGYSDHFSYDEVLELCRKNPEKFSNSSKNYSLYKSQDVTSSGSSKLSSRSFNMSSGEYAESVPSGVDESPQELNKESYSNTPTTGIEVDQV